MMVGWWTCPPDLRDRLARWERLDDGEARAAENDLGLMASVLERR